MLPDFSDIFSSYEQLRKESDALFAHISAKYPACVTCEPGCSDCCHALFDLSLVEAMYINHAFNKKFPHGPERSRLLDKAAAVDRNLAKTKHQLFQDQKKGETPQSIMDRASAMRMPCPLLNDANECVLYEDRPITCRLYGVPQAIGGKTHVCWYSAFDPGQSYPTVQVGKLQERLEDLSRELAKKVKSRFEFDDVYVPLSMALLTRYDEKYLGIGQPKTDD